MNSLDTQLDIYKTIHTKNLRKIKDLFCKHGYKSAY